MARIEQEEIPMEGAGVAPQKKIRPLEDAIAEWNAVKERRMRLTETEVEKRDAALALMLKHELNTYQFEDDRKVVLKEGVKVEKIKPAGEANGE